MTGKDLYERQGDHMEVQFEMGQDNWENLDQCEQARWNFIASLITYPSHILIEWVDSRIAAEVENRPDINIHKRTLSETWNQVRRKLVSLEEASR